MNMNANSWKEADKRRIEQLFYLLQPKWDGDLICKQSQARLVKCGYAVAHEGWTLITPKGLDVLLNLGLLSA